MPTLSERLLDGISDSTPDGMRYGTRVGDLREAARILSAQEACPEAAELLARADAIDEWPDTDTIPREDYTANLRAWAADKAKLAEVEGLPEKWRDRFRSPLKSGCACALDCSRALGTAPGEGVTG